MKTSLILKIGFVLPLIFLQTMLLWYFWGVRPVCSDSEKIFIADLIAWSGK